MENLKKVGAAITGNLPGEAALHILTGKREYGVLKQTHIVGVESWTNSQYHVPCVGLCIGKKYKYVQIHFHPSILFT